MVTVLVVLSLPVVATHIVLTTISSLHQPALGTGS